MSEHPAPPAAPEPPTARERILRAAAEEFSEHGFSGARINRIAANANANKQLIYHYFDSKEGVYAAVLDEMLTSLHHSTAGATAVRDMLRHQIGSAETRRAWSRMVAWEGLADERPVVSAEQRQASIDSQVQTIIRLQREGRFAPGLDPRFALATIYAIGIAPYVIPQLVDFCIGPDAATSEDTMSAWVDQVERMFTRRTS